MINLEYIQFNEVDPKDFLPLLNSSTTRKHLIEHEIFTIDTLKNWMSSKIKVNATHGCKVRAINCNGELAGWCGIQLEDEKYEVAIIIDDKFWGLGKRVFKDTMNWAKEMGHKEIYINFLETRPDYKFLTKIAKSVFHTELYGRRFTCYQLIVS